MSTITISVDVSLKRAVCDAYDAWRPAGGGRIVSLLPQSAGTGNTIRFSWVPEEFLQVLDDVGISYELEH
jgi:hypothetical protein